MTGTRKAAVLAATAATLVGGLIAGPSATAASPGARTVPQVNLLCSGSADVTIDPNEAGDNARIDAAGVNCHSPNGTASELNSFTLQRLRARATCSATNVLTITATDETIRWTKKDLSDGTSTVDIRVKVDLRDTLNPVEINATLEAGILAGNEIKVVVPTSAAVIEGTCLTGGITRLTVTQVQVPFTTGL